MRKIPLFLVVFIFAFVPVSAQRTSLEECLKRMKEHQKSLMSLKADITINKFSAESGETYSKEGTIKFVPQVGNYFLRIDSTKPEPESFLVVKNEYVLYQPVPSRIFLAGVKTAYTGEMTDSQKNMVAVFPILAKEDLRANYTIKYSGQETVNDATSTWHIELTPIIMPKQVKTYKTIELWIDKNGMPIQARVVENNGDWINILFGNLKKNVAINAADFKIDLPKETKVIKK